MWRQFLKKFFINFFAYGWFFLIIGFWVFSFSSYVWIPLVFILAIAASYSASKDIFGEYKQKYEEETKQREQAQKETKLRKQSLIEKNAGYPTLLQAIEYYEKVKDEKVEQFLRYKSHPSRKGAEVVKEEAQRRRQAEYENKKTQAIIEYYESIAPFLVDFKNDIIGIKDEEKYREYVGYLYETQGYGVDYEGIFKGYEDLGRDLICGKGNKIIVIQCKNWSQFKTIYEKHIFQFFGTVFQYRDSNPDKKVESIFYTTTQVSSLAKRFADELGIGLKENFKFDQSYPCIKCNVNRVTKEKIYHLPFDQQYDNTKIFEKGEFYCRTTEEAERKGFRRAFRWHGPQQSA